MTSTLVRRDKDADTKEKAFEDSPLQATEKP